MLRSPLFQTALMTSPARPPANPATQDLASRIYVELVGRAFLRSDNTAVIKPDAAELAKLALQLAETFRALEAAAGAAAGPRNVDYRVDLADMAKWEK
jgi:phosphotransacetylase